MLEDFTVIMFQMGKVIVNHSYIDKIIARTFQDGDMVEDLFDYPVGFFIPKMCCTIIPDFFQVL